MSRVAITHLGLAVLAVLCLTLSAHAQPKMPPAAQETMALTIEAVKQLEAYENTLSGGKEKPDETAVAKSIAESVKKAAAKLTEYAKVAPAEKSGHVKTAQTRLEWAAGILERDKLVKRAHVMEYLQEAIFQVFMSAVKIGPL